MNDKITLQITIKIETTKRKAEALLQRERKRYAKCPCITLCLDDGSEKLATAEEALPSDIDAYLEVLDRAITIRHGAVVSCSGHWIDGFESSWDLAQDENGKGERSHKLLN